MIYISPQLKALYHKHQAVDPHPEADPQPLAVVPHPEADSQPLAVAPHPEADPQPLAVVPTPPEAEARI